MIRSRKATRTSPPWLTLVLEVSLASQRVWFCTMGQDHAEGLLIAKCFAFQSAHFRKDLKTCQYYSWFSKSTDLEKSWELQLPAPAKIRAAFRGNRLTVTCPVRCSVIGPSVHVGHIRELGSTPNSFAIQTQSASQQERRTGDEKLRS